MAYRIVRNTAQNAVLIATASNSAIVIAGNNGTSALGLSSVTDNIVGASIKQIWFSSDSGAGANGWDIIRGANTVWSTDSTGWQDFAGNGCGITLDKAATLTLTRTGSRGTIMVELQKEYAAGHRASDSNY
jgi:hypothetical protein